EVGVGREGQGKGAAGMGNVQVRTYYHRGAESGTGCGPADWGGSADGAVSLVNRDSKGARTLTAVDRNDERWPRLSASVRLRPIVAGALLAAPGRYRRRLRPCGARSKQSSAPTSLLTRRRAPAAARRRAVPGA